MAKTYFSTNTKRVATGENLMVSQLTPTLDINIKDLSGKLLIQTPLSRPQEPSEPGRTFISGPSRDSLTGDEPTLGHFLMACKSEFNEGPGCSGRYRHQGVQSEVHIPSNPGALSVYRFLKQSSKKLECTKNEQKVFL